MGWPVEASWSTGGTLAPCRFATIDPSTDRQVLQCTVTGQPTIGITQEGQASAPGLTGSDAAVAASSGETNFKLHAPGDICLLEAGGTFNAGAELMTDTAGKGILATSGYYIGAIAREAGVSGRKVSVMVVRYQKSGVGSSGV